MDLLSHLYICCPAVHAPATHMCRRYLYDSRGLTHAAAAAGRHRKGRLSGVFELTWSSERVIWAEGVRQDRGHQSRQQTCQHILRKMMHMLHACASPVFCEVHWMCKVVHRMPEGPANSSLMALQICLSGGLMSAPHQKLVPLMFASLHLKNR